MFKLKIYDQRSMLFNQMKNNKYHRTLQNLIPSKKEAKSIPLIHKYMTTHFPGLVQANQ